MWTDFGLLGQVRTKKSLLICILKKQQFLVSSWVTDGDPNTQMLEKSWNREAWPHLQMARGLRGSRAVRQRLFYCNLVTSLCFAVIPFHYPPNSKVCSAWVFRHEMELVRAKQGKQPPSKATQEASWHGWYVRGSGDIRDICVWAAF